MNKRGDIFRRILLLLALYLGIGFGGMMGVPQHLQAQPLLEPPTNTGEELKKALLSLKPVLVNFGSNKCIPCRQLRPILKEVAQELSGEAHVLVIDVFEHRVLAREHRIQLIPTLVFFNRSGKEIFRRSGVWDKASIAGKLKEAGTI
jgi:thiol-disulfide isomerase/thioredoxin